MYTDMYVFKMLHATHIRKKQKTERLIQHHTHTQRPQRVRTRAHIGVCKNTISYIYLHTHTHTHTHTYTHTHIYIYIYIYL